jgi:hypothetical protein
MTACGPRRSQGARRKARLPYRRRDDRQSPCSQIRASGQGQPTTRAVIAEIQRTGAGTLKAIAQELEARGVRTPAGRDRWDAKQVSRLLVA